MSSRISLYIAATTLALGIIGCGGARVQVPVTPEETTPAAEPMISFGTVAEVVAGPAQLTTDPSNNGLGSYHPNGSRIVFQSDRDGRWQIYQRDLLSGVEELVTGSESDDENPMWLPDSSGILFVSNRNHPRSEFARDIFFYDPVSIQIATLTENAADDWYPVPIDPDSYYFLSEPNDAEGNPTYETPNGLYRGMLDGSPAEMVAGIDVNPSAPADLEDGALLVRTNEGQLAKLGANGQLELLTPASLVCGTAAYSHVRKFVAFNAREEEVYHLYLFDLEKKIVQKIETGEGEVRFPQFSPDGGKILFSQEVEGKFQLFQLELAQQLWG